MRFEILIYAKFILSAIRLQHSVFCGIMRLVKIDLSKYANLNICVAVSGGRDSMALLSYLLEHGVEFNISVCAVNFDHKIRGESSARDSAFVSAYCHEKGVPLLFFEWDEDIAKTETSAHNWRFSKYCQAVLPEILPDGTLWKGADAVATAHHLNDNAETVLFNLARGSGLAGLTGIGDLNFTSGNKPWKLIRPLAEVSRKGIDGYVLQNSIPFVDDETNFTEDYTRNKIRRRVLPELEKAVPDASKAIYRFSRIAAEDEEYFENLINERGLTVKTPYGYEILHCPEKPVFKRAALNVLRGEGVRDYTCEWLDKLYSLQFAQKGKKFEFSEYTAYCEDGKIAICISNPRGNPGECIPFSEYVEDRRKSFSGRQLYFGKEEYIGKEEGFDGGNAGTSLVKTLRFDFGKIPGNADIRFMRTGDVFEKFGGGRKNLGSYFTDVKIPVRIRKNVPVVASGSEILIVCGVEISDKVKIDGGTENVAICAAEDYLKLSKS